MKLKMRAVLVGILIIVAYLMLFSVSVPPIFGLFTEIISGLAVIGIAVLLYPLLKKHKLVNSYVGLKFVEGILMIVAGVFVLFQNLEMYDKLYAVHVYAFSISALFLYILLERERLVPKFINVWGAVAAILVLLVNIYIHLGFEITLVFEAILLAPIILNEFFLAIWLMVKGFNKKRKGGK